LIDVCGICNTINQTYISNIISTTTTTTTENIESQTNTILLVEQTFNQIRSLLSISTGFHPLVLFIYVLLYIFHCDSYLVIDLLSSNETHMLKLLLVILSIAISDIDSFIDACDRCDMIAKSKLLIENCDIKKSSSESAIIMNQKTVVWLSYQTTFSITNNNNSNNNNMPKLGKRKNISDVDKSRIISDAVNSARHEKVFEVQENNNKNNSVSSDPTPILHVLNTSCNKSETSSNTQESTRIEDEDIVCNSLSMIDEFMIEFIDNITVMDSRGNIPFHIHTLIRKCYNFITILNDRNSNAMKYD
jgi:hypothetical protein